MNIMGALNLETMNLVYEEFETSIKSETAVEFLKKLEAAYPGTGRIHLIWDQAGYHKGNDILKYLETSRIKVHYLPPRSPNLNAIERLWKIIAVNLPATTSLLPNSLIFVLVFAIFLIIQCIIFMMY